jgi:chorismate dehydratase
MLQNISAKNNISSYNFLLSILFFFNVILLCNIMLRISVVSYLNSLPFIDGIENSHLSNKIQLNIEIPSKCAKSFQDGNVDIALVPVGILPILKDYKIISDYCIGADGPVKTVLLLSQVKLSEIKTIFLDFHSITSINLVKVLAKNFWNILPDYQNTSSGDYSKNRMFESAVMIGDKTFELAEKYKFVYDLAEEWKKFTNLPFVFACWVSKNSISDDAINQFNDALEFGIRNKHITAKQYAVDNNLMEDEIQHYLDTNIKYELGEIQKISMKKFLSMI